MNLLASFDAAFGAGATRQLAKAISQLVVPVSQKCARLEKVLGDLSGVVEVLPSRLRDIDNRLSELERKL